MAGYVSSLRDYVALLRRPRVASEMFDVRPSDPKQLFQDWSVLKCFVGLFCGPSFCLFLALRAVSERNAYQALHHVAAALWVALFVLAFNHLAWHCVVRRSGPCGPIAYVGWSVVYLLAFVVALGQWFRALFVEEKVLESGGRVPITLALGPFLSGLSDVFMVIACEALAAAGDLESPLLNA